MDSCETCRFWKKGKCRRYPEYIARKKSDWCGEHERVRFFVKPGAKK